MYQGNMITHTHTATSKSGSNAEPTTQTPTATAALQGPRELKFSRAGAGSRSSAQLSASDTAHAALAATADVVGPRFTDSS